MSFRFPSPRPACSSRLGTVPRSIAAWCRRWPRRRRLDAAKGDNQSVFDDGAAPLGHTFPVEEGGVLLNLAARQSGLPAHFCLLDGDALVLLPVGVVRSGVRDEDHVELTAGVCVREAHYDGAGELVCDAVLVSGIGGDGNNIPRLLANGGGQSGISHESTSS